MVLELIPSVKLFLKLLLGKGCMNLAMTHLMDIELVLATTALRHKVVTVNVQFTEDSTADGAKFNLVQCEAYESMIRSS